MDRYTRIMAITAIIVFSAAGFVIVKAIIHYLVNMPKDEVVYLNTRQMNELSDRDFDSANMTFVTAYLCKKTNKKDSSTLWADAFVYAADYRGHYSTPDTIVILDTALMDKLPDDIEDYSIGNGDTVGKDIPRCRVVIPSDKIASFKNYKYKYKELWLLEE